MPRPKLPAARHEVAELPDAWGDGYAPFDLDDAGAWLVLSDVHAPHHDRVTLELAMREARRRKVVGVLLNGDTIDCHKLSDHEHDEGAPDYADELKVTRTLLRWVRSQLPKVRLVLKEGNHEERLGRQIGKRMPELRGLVELGWSSLLQLDRVGGEWVGDRRPVMLGKLPVLHGHEFPGRGFSGADPARALWNKARTSAMAGHHHQHGTFTTKDVRGRYRSTWSLGCACYVTPRYARINNWSNGFAVVEVSSDGQFNVENKRVRDGRVEG